MAKYNQKNRNPERDAFNQELREKVNSLERQVNFGDLLREARDSLRDKGWKLEREILIENNTPCTSLVGTDCYDGRPCRAAEGGQYKAAKALGCRGFAYITDDGKHRLNSHIYTDHQNANFDREVAVRLLAKRNQYEKVLESYLGTPESAEPEEEITEDMLLEDAE